MFILTSRSKVGLSCPALHRPAGPLPDLDWLGHKKLESSRSVAGESGTLKSACCFRMEVGRREDWDSGTKDRSPSEGREKGFRF